MIALHQEHSPANKNIKVFPNNLYSYGNNANNKTNSPLKGINYNNNTSNKMINMNMGNFGMGTLTNMSMANNSNIAVGGKNIHLPAISKVANFNANLKKFNQLINK